MIARMDNERHFIFDDVRVRPIHQRQRHLIDQFGTAGRREYALHVSHMIAHAIQHNQRRSTLCQAARPYIRRAGCAQINQIGLTGGQFAPQAPDEGVHPGQQI